MKAVLTIAGSDSSGGAGIQADLKTIAAHQLFGESVITALTAQNTTGVFGVMDVDPAFVGAQMDAVFDDIRPEAVKIGMVSSPAIVRAIADGLRRHRAENIVVDPVMVATSGSALIADEAVDALVAELFPLAAVVTPNIPEAEVLAGMVISCADDVERAAELIAARRAAAAEISPNPDAGAPRAGHYGEGRSRSGRSRCS
ncbi:MAG: bifunctional hydroxymethylpyrimidine kinase/phosphomethylpyrimidine kinase [Adlercreutzia equolifaciens]